MKLNHHFIFLLIGLSIIHGRNLKIDLDDGLDFFELSDEIIDGKKNGKILTEGEVNTILGYKGREQITENYSNNNNSDDNNNDEGNEKRNALVQRAWPRVAGKLFIPYVISDTYTATQRTNIENAVTKMNAHLSPCNTPTENVWKTRTTETNYVIFQTGNGCSSFVGNAQLNPQSITLADGCISTSGGIILHEMLHAMGFFHEHTRTDRDKFVEILKDNIDTDIYNVNFVTVSVADPLCTVYDYESVMHYGRQEFSNNGMDTIRTFDVSKQDVIGQRMDLSAGDILRVRRLYSCGETTPIPCNFVTTTPAKPTTTTTTSPTTTTTTAAPTTTTTTAAPTTTTTTTGSPITSIIPPIPTITTTVTPPLTSTIQPTPQPTATMTTATVTTVTTAPITTVLPTSSLPFVIFICNGFPCSILIITGPWISTLNSDDNNNELSKRADTCVDGHIFCPHWTNNCGDNAYVIQNCLLSCKRCPTTTTTTTAAATTTTTTTTTTTAGNCLDKSTYCPFWTSHCSTNQFVIENCLFSCGRCSTVNSHISLSSGSSGTLAFPPLNRMAVTSTLNCQCTGDFATDRAAYQANCARQYYCFEALIKRQSTTDETITTVELSFKQITESSVIIPSIFLTKNQWLPVQHQVYGYCDQFEAKLVANRDDRDVILVARLQISHKKCESTPFADQMLGYPTLK